MWKRSLTVRFKSTTEALEIGDVRKWRLVIDGHSCKGVDLGECLSEDTGRNGSTLQMIFESRWSQDDAEGHAREQMMEEKEMEWRDSLPSHPDLFRGNSTPMFDDEEMPEFELNEDAITERTYEDFRHELQWCWDEVSAHLKKDEIKEALEWLGLTIDKDVKIDGFDCISCHDESDYDGRHCTSCTAPICSNCFNNYCGACGYDYNVEDKLELNHQAETGREHQHDAGGGEAGG
jgi:hypothetical protein